MNQVAAATLAIFPAIPLQETLINPIVSPKTKEANVNISHTTAVLSAELLEEKVGPMAPGENAGQSDEVPAVVGHADDEDEDDEENEEDEDDLDEDEERDDDDFDDDFEPEEDDEEEDEEKEDEEEGYLWTACA